MLRGVEDLTTFEGANVFCMSLVMIDTIMIIFFKIIYYIYVM